MNPTTLSRKANLSARQIRYWIEHGYVGKQTDTRGLSGERELTKKETERILSISTLVNSLGMKPSQAAVYAKQATMSINGVYEAEVHSVSLFWKNPTL